MRLTDDFWTLSISRLRIPMSGYETDNNALVTHPHAEGVPKLQLWAPDYASL